ncbi:DegT/DnrJ/EryC1/StrS family aminotransferase [bacterium]|nr:DegT/DnrJ/EryC1/StrS family aminotransferase [bacterium]
MVPFVDLKAQYQSIKSEIDTAIQNVLNNAAFVLGPAVAEFEGKFAKYTNTKHAVAVNSGTSALHLALLAIGIKPGDEVIVPAMTFIATGSAVDYIGAKVVLADVNPKSYTLDPTKIEAAITPKTKVIMPVHLYGQSADMDPILKIAKKHNLFVVEDAAQAHGSEYKHRRCGSIGDIAGFSFYPGKNLGAYGEGGAVVTNNDEYAEKVRMLRDWGQQGKGNHVMKAFNYRMTGFQGAVLGVKIDHIERWTESRRRAAELYNTLLAGVEGVVAPTQMEYARHVYHVYGVLVKNRAEVQAKLNNAGVQNGVHYTVPMHLHPCYAELGYKKGDFPVAERIAEEELSLPMFGEITREQVEEVVEKLK